MIKLMFFIEKIISVSTEQWQVGKGRFTNFADATEPINQLSSPCIHFKTISLQEDFFSKPAWALYSGEF